jgi:hypothetical protein
MKKRLIISILAGAAVMPVVAQINSTGNDGYLKRGEAMYADRNYTGCIDQLARLDRAALSESEREESDWLISMANFNVSGRAAKPHFVAFLSMYPYSLHRQQALMRIGDCLFETSFADALKVYQMVNPDALPAAEADELAYREGYCRLQLADFDTAASRFSSLLSSRRYANAARFYLGYIAYVKGDYNEAKRLFKDVDTSAEPGNMADYYLSQIYFVDGDYNRALSTAKSLLRRNDSRSDFVAEANRIAGESLYHTGRGSEAIGYLKKYRAAVENPSLSTLYILGLAEYEQGDYARAIEALEPVSADDSAMGQSAYLYIGQALVNSGNKSAALLAFDKALRLPYDTKVQEAAFYNYAVAKFDGATIPFGSTVSTFEEFLRRYPDSDHAAEVQEYIVTGYMTDNNYESALESIERMKNPGDKILAAKQQILYTLGARALSTGNPKRAISYLTAVEPLARYNREGALEAKLLLGEAQYRDGDYESAVKNLKAYLAKAPVRSNNAAIASYDLGYAQFALKDYDEARRSFEKFAAAPSQRPDALADAYNRLGDISYYASDFTEAGRLYDKSYQLNPAAGDYSLFQKALMRGYERDHRAKIAGLEKMLADFPSSTLAADAMLEMTSSYIQLGDNASAIKVYRRLVSEYPNTAQGRQGYLQLALTLLNDGKKPQAVDAYKDVIRLYPTSEEAREAVDALKLICAEDGTLAEYMEFINSVPDAPKIDISEVDRLTFETAERDYITEGSIARLEAYTKKYPDGAYFAKATSYLLEAAVEDGDDDKAYGYATALVERFPDNSLSENAYAVVATRQYNLGQTEPALATWRALEQRASSSKNLNAARTGIMRAARDLSDYEAVIAAADALLASSTLGSEDKTEAIFSRGIALEMRGDREAARDEWRKIAAVTDDLYGAKSAYYLSQSLFDDKKVDEARKTVEALNASGTPHSYWLARGFILLSDIFEAQGKSFEAKEYLKALKENYPGDETDIFMMIDNRLNK